MAGVERGLSRGKRGEHDRELQRKGSLPEDFAADASRDDIEKATLADDRSKHYMDGKSVVKVIVVPKRIVNIVLK